MLAMTLTVSCKKKLPGFTLIEVLIALVIIAIAMTAVLHAMQQSIVGVSEIRSRFAAHFVVLNVVSSTQVGLIAPPGLNAKKSGSEKMFHTRYTWRMGVARAGSPYYERIFVNVFHGSRRLQHLEGFIWLGETNNA